MSSQRGDDLGPVALPRDCRMHQGRSEWWWFAGRLSDVHDDRLFSWSQSLMRHDRWLVGFLRWQEHDPDTGQRIGPERLVRGVASRRAGYSESAFTPDFRLVVEWPGEDRLETEGCMGTYRIRAEGAHGAALHVRRGPDRPVLLGRRGVVDYGGGRRLGYYSFMRLRATGRLSTPEGPVAVQGPAWLDHQWGPVDTREMVWRYLALQVGDAELLAFDAFHQDTPHHRRVLGMLRRDGQCTEVPGIRLEPRGEQASATRVALGDRGHLDVTPVPDDQVLDLDLPGVPVFYEGYSRVRGILDDEPVHGWGITELQPWGG